MIQNGAQKTFFPIRVDFGMTFYSARLTFQNWYILIHIAEIIVRSILPAQKLCIAAGIDSVLNTPEFVQSWSSLQ